MTSTYTNNWPHEPLIDNNPTTANLIWSFISVIILLAGVGALIWYKAFTDKEEDLPTPASTDPFNTMPITPSMRAAGKYALIVIALFVAQSVVGGVLAHFTVEGNAFYGFPLSDYLPYSIVRTWHI